MNVLHIAGDYPYTALYQQLLIHLEGDPSLRQTLYVPLPHGAPFYRKYDYDTEQSHVLYGEDYGKLDKFWFGRKIKKIDRAMEKVLDPRKFDVGHSHYLFSNGAVSMRFKERYGVPFVTSVRNTDLNFYFKNAFHLRWVGVKVLEAAAGVVFLSPAYRETTLERFVPASKRDAIRKKSVIIPNGINSFWFENPGSVRGVAEAGKARLLYVGELTTNKNLETTIQAAKLLREGGTEVSLRIVGDGPHRSAIEALGSAAGDWVEMRPWTQSKDELREYYGWADAFVMPSFAETFGLVYPEAMSQGTPLIWTKGQGIDGHFEPGTVGFAVDPSSAHDVAEKLSLILGQRETMSGACLERVELFRWETVAESMRSLYRRAME